MAPITKPSLSITHVTTATAILDIDGVTFLTDPFFGVLDGTEYDLTQTWENADLKAFGLETIPPPPHLVNYEGPRLQLHDLPPIDAVLLSHEDHMDNLDPEGRRLLDGRRVFTTMDGASNLRPRPGIVGLRPWETVTATIGGKVFRITGTPCKHFPGGEVSGFILETDSFGIHESGKPNAIYFSGDTVYIDELREIGNRWHVTAALLNLGNATFDFPVGQMQITMDGKQAVRLIREIGADIMIPIHFESWAHFTEDREGLMKFSRRKGLWTKCAGRLPVYQRLCISFTLDLSWLVWMILSLATNNRHRAFVARISWLFGKA